jgi:hypothetical protein
MAIIPGQWRELETEWSDELPRRFLRRLRKVEIKLIVAAPVKLGLADRGEDE